MVQGDIYGTDQLVRGFLVDSRGSFFVQSEQLLPLSQDPRFRGGWMTLGRDQLVVDGLLVENADQVVTVGVQTPQTDQSMAALQTFQVHGHVACTAEARGPFIHLDNRHRRFG